MRQSKTLGIVYRLALVSMLLRVAVPAGFMPASLGDGWYLKLCPDGMPVNIMMALFGHEHHHHMSEEPAYAQCELGGGLATDVTALDACSTSPPESTVTNHRRSEIFTADTRHAHSYQPRAPPVFRLT